MSIKICLAYAGFATAFAFILALTVLAGHDGHRPAIKAWTTGHVLGGRAETEGVRYAEGASHERLPLRR